MNRPQALVLIGPMGAGKSVVGARVAQRLGWRFVDVDAQVERRSGMSIPALFAERGEAAFRAIECAALRDALDACEVVVSTGGGAVLDAGNRAAMRAAGMVVHLHVDVEAQLQRLRDDVSRPLLDTDDRDARLRTLADVRGPLYADIAHLRIDTGLRSLDDVTDAVLDALETCA